MRQARYWIILLPLFLVLTCVGAYAQANSDVTGIVTDQTGAVVAGATVTLTDPATGTVHTTVSSGAGLYDISGLNPANYNLKVTAKGFQTYVQSGVVVNISRTFRVDVKLTIGVESQTITVTADALTVQTDSNVVSTLISGQQITELPTNGRSVISLASLGLGVSGNLPDMNSPFSVTANYAISFNGLNQAHNIWIVDGGEAYDRGSGGKMAVMPSQDALGEFQVLSSNYPPDYGIASGGTITMNIKSGTSKLHGGAWEFVRNDALDARNYFNPAPQHVAELRYNVFGANVGGPVFIPHAYNSSRNKTFFFVNEEWRRLVQGVSTNTIHTVPAADIITSAATFNYALRGGSNTDQTAAGVSNQIFVPQVAASSTMGGLLQGHGYTCATVTANVGAPPTVTPASCSTPGISIAPNQPFVNNTIPANLLDPNAILFNKTMNLPAENPAGSGTYTPTGGHLPVMVREDLFRIDHNFNEKWSILGHFIHDAMDTVEATPEWQGDSYPTIGSNFSNPAFSSVIKLTGALKPNVLLEAAFNYDGNKIAIIPVSTVAAGFTKPTGWSTGTYFPAANDVGNRLPDFNWGTMGTSWGPGNDPWTNGAEDFNEIYALSVTVGRHQMKFGGGYNRYTKNQVIGKDSEGDYNFDDGWNGPCPATGSCTYIAHTPSGSLTGDSYLDFLLGLSTQFSQANANPINHYVNNTISGYAQDNWHVSSRLSIQYGVRYDAMPHVWERNNMVSNFNPALYQAGQAPTLDTGTGAFCTATSTTCPSGASAGLQTYTLGGVATQFYMNGVAIAGQNGTPRSLVKNDYKTWMPRIGFSYDVAGNGKTVIRGGFGTFYERIQGNDIYDAAGSAPFISTPTVKNVGLTNVTANWATGSVSSPSSAPIFAQGFNSLPTYYPDPAVAQYSLGVQHEIAPALILTTQYVGNLEWHQNEWIPINNFPLSTSMAIRQLSASGNLNKTTSSLAPYGAANSNMFSTYPGFANIRLQETPATGSYNSLQVGLREQNRHGLSFEIDYTWSHQIDTTTGSVDVDNNNPSYNPWNLKYDKGSGILDRRQILNITYEYKLPFFMHSSGLEKSILGGWEISGLVLDESGMPWFGNEAPNNDYPDTIGLGGDYKNRFNQSGKPVYTKAKTTVGTGSTAVTGYQYVSSSAFSAPVAAWAGGPNMGFGNAGKDAVVGAGRVNFTTSLYKSFAFGERAHVELRAESFNTFNHTQFNGLSDTNPADNAFGFVNSAQDPRVFEFGGKFMF